MPYKISGTKSETGRVIIIKESDWSIESNTVVSGSGAYIIEDLEAGSKLAFSRANDGEVLGYGDVTAIEYSIPVPTREVGSGKEFSTINAAIQAADEGDQINVYPGTYNEMVEVDRIVNLRAITNTPSSQEVSISMNVVGNAPIFFDLPNPETEKTIIIEGFYITREPASWQVLISTGNVNKPNLSVTLNKCYFQAQSNQYPLYLGGYLGEGILRNVVVSYSTIVRGYSHIWLTNWNNMNNGGRLDKVELNDAYYCYECVGSPAYNDNVSTPTAGYGSDYGDYILTVV